MREGLRSRAGRSSHRASRRSSRNPDGGGPIDLDAQRSALETRGLGPNVALLIGHGSVRARGAGPRRARARRAGARRAWRPSSIARCRPVPSASRAGCSTRQVRSRSTDEVVALAKRVAPFAGVYTSHIRDEGNYDVGLLASVDEVIQIAEEAGVTGIVSHMKALGARQLGKGSGGRGSHRACARARRPCVRRPVSLRGVVHEPPGRRDPGLGAGCAGRRACRAPVGRPGDPAEASRRGAREHPPAGWRRRRCRSPTTRPIGRSRARSSTRLRRRAVVEPRIAALTLAERAASSIVSFNMDDRDILDIMRAPVDHDVERRRAGPRWTRACRIRATTAPSRASSPVTSASATPCRLEQAVHSMTGLSADVFGFADRGRSGRRGRPTS